MIDEITKCSCEQNLRKKLQEVELHPGNDGIPPLLADWPEGRQRFEVGRRKSLSQRFNNKIPFPTNVN